MTSENITRFIATKFKNGRCPVCEEKINISLINTEGDQPVIMSKEGNILNIYSVFCTNCFIVTSFLKFLIDREMNKGAEEDE